MKTKLIFLFNHSFTDRDYERFGVQYYLDHNIDIQIWDLSFVNKVNGEIKAQNTKKIKFIYFESLEDLISKTIIINGSYIIDLRVTTNNNFISANWFTNKGGIIVKHDNALVPSNYISLIDKILFYKSRLSFLINKFGFFNIILIFFNKILYYNKLKKNIEFGLHICSGNITADKINSEKVYSHVSDYDYYLKEMKSEELSGENIVFLDNGMCDHPDYELHNVPSYATPDLYYPKMNDFFEKIENFYNKKIIISSHPKINRDPNELSRLFGGREVFTGSTCKIVRNAILVLTHDSTALNFAVLWKRPLIFLTSNEILKRNYLIRKFIKALKVKNFNIDKSYDNIDWIFEGQKALKSYSEYKRNYIKHPMSVDKYSWEILVNFFQKKLNSQT